MIERIATTLFYPTTGLLTDISLNMTFIVIGSITIILSFMLRVEENEINPV
jgi:hypothetical protein